MQQDTSTPYTQQVQPALDIQSHVCACAIEPSRKRSEGSERLLGVGELSQRPTADRRSLHRARVFAARLATAAAWSYRTGVKPRRFSREEWRVTMSPHLPTLVVCTLVPFGGR